MRNRLRYTKHTMSRQTYKFIGGSKDGRTFNMEQAGKYPQLHLPPYIRRIITCASGAEVIFYGHESMTDAQLIRHLIIRHLPGGIFDNIEDAEPAVRG